MKAELTHDFFRFLPTVPCPPAEEYKRIEPMVKAIIAFARNQNLEGYIVDYAQKRFVYVSGGLGRLIGGAAGAENRLEVQDLVEHIPAEDRKVLEEAYRNGLEWFRNLHPDNRLQTVLTYETHLFNGKRKSLFHHKLSPMYLTPCGHIWMAVCLMKLSAHKTAGHITAINKLANTVLEYDLHARQWKEKEFTALKPMEKDILFLSARGYNTTQIAQEICKSEDAVKSCKQKLYKRWGVGTKEEILIMAMNLGLI